MVTQYKVLSDIFDIEKVVQQTGIMHAKNILIDTLRNVFSQDRHFKFVTDVFGFPKTPSHLGLEPDAGLDDEETTRIFIGSGYRYDVKFNPSIIIRNTGTSYKPISFNQNIYNVTNIKEVLMDGYGNQTIIYSPSYHEITGAWDQSFEIKIVTENEADREELADIVMVMLIGSRRTQLKNSGVFVKSVSTGGESEQQYGNDYLYSVSIKIDVRSEWKIRIPISNVIERIGICLSFKTLDNETSNALSINESISLVDSIAWLKLFI